MISERAQGLYSIVIGCQVALAGALYAGLIFFFQIALGENAFTSIGNYLTYGFLVMVGLIFEAFFRSDAERNLLYISVLAKNRVALWQCLTVLLVLLLFLVGIKDIAISRKFLFSYVFLFYVVMLGSSYYLPVFLANRFFRGSRKERTLLLGSTEKAHHLHHWLRRKKTLGIEVIGILSDTPHSGEFEFPVLGRLEDLETVIKDRQITQILIVEFPESIDSLSDYAQITEMYGIRFLLVDDLKQHFHHAISYAEDDGIRLIGLRQEPLENPVHRAMKRLIDLAIAIPVSLTLFPLCATLVALLQLWQSPGPLVIRQSRAGIQNRGFKIFKFRTMHPQIQDEARQATIDDERIFPAGRWLRRFSIDEIPQFLNVFLGDMSVVGPRPHLEKHNEEFAQLMANYHVRAYVKPGITGLAQVRGFRGETRTTEDIQKRLESDIYYIENWNLWLDALITFRTIAQLIAPSSKAY